MSIFYFQLFLSSRLYYSGALKTLEKKDDCQTEVLILISSMKIKRSICAFFCKKMLIFKTIFAS